MGYRAILSLTLAPLALSRGGERGHWSHRKEILRAVLCSFRTIALARRAKVTSEHPDTLRFYTDLRLGMIRCMPLKQLRDEIVLENTGVTIP